MTPADLKAARLRLGLTQPALAKALGVDTATIFRWEHGHRAIPPYLHLAIAQLEQQKEQPQ